MEEKDLSKRRFLNLVFNTGILFSASFFCYSTIDIQSCRHKIHQQILMFSKPLRHPLTVSRKEGEMTIIYVKGKSDVMLKINESADYIWHMCDGEYRIRDIATVMSATFDVPPSESLRDVAATINIFRSYGVISL